VRIMKCRLSHRLRHRPRRACPCRPRRRPCAGFRGSSEFCVGLIGSYISYHHTAFTVGEM